MTVEFSPTMYALDEGEVADLRVVLVGTSILETRVIINTGDASASGMYEQ